MLIIIIIFIIIVVVVVVFLSGYTSCLLSWYRHYYHHHYWSLLHELLSWPADSINFTFCCCCCSCSLFVYRICTEFDSGEILAHSTLLFESILWFTKPGLLSDQDVPGEVRFSWVLLTSALSTAWKSCSPCCCHVMAQRQIYSPSDRFCRHQKCSPKTGQQF